MPTSFEHVSRAGWLGLAYVSLFSMLIGFVFWYRGLAQGGIAAVGQLQLFHHDKRLILPYEGGKLSAQTDLDDWSAAQNRESFVKLGIHALAVVAIASLGSLSSAYAAEKCPLSKAHYTLSSDKRISISFVPVGKHEDWGSDVTLRIDTDGPSYWFMFDGGSARYVNMISTTDVKAPHWTPPTGDSGPRPLGEMHYFAWSGKYDFDEAYPQTYAAFL